MSAGRLLDFDTAADAGAGLAGGKGTTLGRLRRYGLPVPAGFVVASTAYADFFDADLHAAAKAAGHDADALAALRRRIAAKPLPAALSEALADELRRRGWETTPLAVRSSAPMEDSRRASFAGIHHSVLNVAGAAALADAVRAVWASLWTPQAVAYRTRLELPPAAAAMAVVVMPLLAARSAGVAFSCDPASGRDDRLVISAVRGLGEALVGGLEAGEEIVVGEDCFDERIAILSRRPARQRSAIVADAAGGTRQQACADGGEILTDADALALAALVRDAANALDFAEPWFDLEWVQDDTGFHLVQARPVTARPWHTYPGLAGQHAIWTNGNTRDVVPQPVNAADWASMRRLINLYLEQGYRLAGYPLLPGAQRGALFSGRLYLNVSFIQWEGFDALGVSPQAMNALLGGHHAEIAVPTVRWRDRLRRIGRLVRYLAGVAGRRRHGRAQAAAAFADCRRWRSEDLAALPDTALGERLRSLFAHVRRQDGLQFLQGSSGGNLHTLLEAVDKEFPGEGQALVAALMAGQEASVSAQQGYDLVGLARIADAEPAVRDWLRAGAPHDPGRLPADSPFRAALAAFLDRHGHRGVYESYLRSPRWRENPAWLLSTLADLAGVDTAALAARQQAAADAAWQRLRARLPRWRLALLRKLVEGAIADGNDRELARSAFTAYSEVGRRLLLEAGRRLRERGALDAADGVFHLLPGELCAALAGTLPAAALRARIAGRAVRFAEWTAAPAPDVVIDGAAGIAETFADDSAATIDADGRVWRGVAVGTGCGEGVARLIDHPEAGHRLAPGEILVAPSTDPAWTPLFLKAGGLVMETGGYLSHGATVAREFGIPAVVNLPGIRGALADGRRVRVDGLAGRVEFLD